MSEDRFDRQLSSKTARANEREREKSIQELNDYRTYVSKEVRSLLSPRLSICLWVK